MGSREYRHVATIRNARGGVHRSIRAARRRSRRAHGITAHLREDHRHIRDDDVERLMAMLRRRSIWKWRRPRK
jgi:pyridoxine 5-phosphate synthase